MLCPPSTAEVYGGAYCPHFIDQQGWESLCSFPELSKESSIEQIFTEYPPGPRQHLSWWTPAASHQRKDMGNGVWQLILVTSWHGFGGDHLTLSQLLPMLRE